MQRTFSWTRGLGVGGSCREREQQVGPSGEVWKREQQVGPWLEKGV